MLGKRIDVVMTRNMVKERENEEKEDEEIVECEKAGTSELSLVSADDEELEWDCDDEEFEEDCGDKVLDDILVDDVESLVKEEAEVEQTSADVKELVDLPCLRKNSAREEFLVETRVDLTFKTCRKLADKNTRGYFWK